jgi:di/tricarboxylate transporter
MSDTTITYLVLATTVGVFVWDRLSVGIVAIGVALSLWATGVLGYEQSLAGFGDPTVIFIASLFVVSEGLESSGVTSWVGQELIEQVGTSRTRLVVGTMLLVAFLTALISVNGSVAALLPVAVVLAVRLGHPPSQLLMPLAFGAHAGSLLTLTGTARQRDRVRGRLRRGGRARRLLRVRARRRPAPRRDDRHRRPLRGATAAEPHAAHDSG